jgi:hypothetical protein
MRNDDDNYDHLTKGLRKQTVGRILREVPSTFAVHETALKQKWHKQYVGSKIILGAK